jgi:lambda family phage portal protein
VPDTDIVGAANMTHLKFVRRLHQTRGVSVLHAVLSRLDDLKEYEESERVAARIAAAFSAYIKRNGDYDPQTDTVTGDRIFEMAPGAIFDSLLPGEDIGTIDTNRPNNEIGTYIAIQERRIASGTGTRYSSVARNYNGTYSAQRQELVEGRVHYLRLFSYLAAKFYRPVWGRFIDAARLAGRIKLVRGLDIPSLYLPEIRPPSLPWIDPKKEVEAHGLAVEKGFRSRWQVIRDLGGDPRQVDAQLEADEFDVRPPEQEPAAETKPKAAEPDDEMADDEEDQEEAA